MEYCHYITRNGDIPDDKWNDLVDFITIIITFCDEKNIGIIFIIEEDFIKIYGKEQTCDVFEFTKFNKQNFTFFNTQKLPYDKAICLILLTIKYLEVLPDLEITSDSEKDWSKKGTNWNNARLDFEEIFGYKPKYPFYENLDFYNSC
jgi:hypothetical protein